MIMFCAIQSGDKVPQTAIVRAVVFVERSVYVFFCSFVHDVDQQSSILHFCDVTGWNWFINHAGIPVNLQGDCDLQERSPSTEKNGVRSHISTLLTMHTSLLSTDFCNLLNIY